MSEFSNRVDAQRALLRIVNARLQNSGEQLFALNSKAIDRWVLSNHIDPSAPVVRLLRQASSRIFEMANHSDDPICGMYRVSSSELTFIGEAIRAAI